MPMSSNLEKLIISFLEQANTPEEFRESLFQALNNSTPLERNQAIAIANHFRAESKKFLEVSERVQKRVYSLIARAFPGAYVVYGRKKDLMSYLQKIDGRVDVNSVRDTYALRVVLSDRVIDTPSAVSFQYRVLKVLIDGLQDLSYTILPLNFSKKKEKLSEEYTNQIFIPKAIDPILIPYLPLFKNYVQYPNGNGYQGLHIIVITPEGITIEIQIRIMSQHVWAERGPASHDVNYKTATEIDKLVAERGSEFIRVLATPTVIGKPLFRNTVKETFPDDEL